jgi:hypothetical protein
MRDSGIPPQTWSKSGIWKLGMSSKLAAVAAILEKVKENEK